MEVEGEREVTVPRYVRAYWRWVSDFDSINYCSISRVTHLRTQREQRYTLELAIYDNRFRPRPTFPRCIYSVLKVILRPNRGSVKLRCRKIMENRFFFFSFSFHSPRSQQNWSRIDSFFRQCVRQNCGSIGTIF